MAPVHDCVPSSLPLVHSRSLYWRDDSPHQAGSKASRRRSVPAALIAHSTSPCLCRLRTTTSQSTVRPHPSWSVSVCVCKDSVCLCVVVCTLRQAQTINRTKKNNAVYCTLQVVCLIAWRKCTHWKKNKANVEIGTTSQNNNKYRIGFNKIDVGLLPQNQM